ncbi:uncharacterized protein LOC103723514 [Phoenix dactylifera]|uniref:Uncharacterized protein LOC103723514 n=1 Tax=Phoenix dactylifera TaxID=42345 RepID=A0A8B7D419_PHODC|nr:uncharacterized protein LOC103723514 [Phoenix dactylifera]
MEDESSPATSEASGDSEADSVFIIPSTAFEFYDDDDAESSSGGCEDENDGDRRDERWMSWRSWLLENASLQSEHMEYDDEQREDGLSTQDIEKDGTMPRVEKESMAKEEGESNRLFWEACLADEYP